MRKQQLLAAVLVASVALGGAVVARAHGGDQARAILVDATGAKAGTVWLQEDEGKVNVRAVVSGLIPGFHGFHIHATGTCDPSIPADPVGGGFHHGSDPSGHHGDVRELQASSRRWPRRSTT